MGFEEQYQQAKKETLPTISGFDSMYRQAQTTPVRPLQRQPVVFRGASAGMTYPYSGTPAETPDIDVIRNLKDFANIGSDFLQARMSGKRWANKAAIQPLVFALATLDYKKQKKIGLSDLVTGRRPKSFNKIRKDVEKEILSEFDKAATRIPKFEVRPATTPAEKVADIVTGGAKFVFKLWLLKKANPNLSGGALWEMENLSSGGTPGLGYAMHGAFSAPGKLIKGVKLPAKAGRLAAESAALASVSAIEQKIDTGEIDPVQVGIAAALPVALRTPKAIKKLIRARHPKVMKAVADIQTGKISPVDTTNKAVIDWSTKAKLLNVTERKVAVHKLRQQQHARYTAKKEIELKKGASSFEAHMAAKKARGGKAGVPEIEPLVLSNAQREVYGRQIETVYPKHKGFQRAGAYDAITKMENGKLPTNYEIGLLEPVFGTETTVKIFQSLKGKKPIELADIPALVRDIPKAIRFGFDPQAARGLSKITLRHPLIYLSALGKNIRGIFSKKYADRVSKAVEASPAYELGKKNYGVHHLSMKPWASVEAGTKLEQYGQISELFLRSKNRVIKGIGRWLRASERGANLGVNDALNKLVIKGEKDLARYGRNKNLSVADIAKWRKGRGHDINIYSKRVTAKHPKIKAIQRAANWVVFSPSYTASGLAAGPQSFIKLATGKGFAGRTYAMQIMLSRVAGLTAASSMVGYAAYKWRLRNPTEEPPIDSSPNPLNPLYGKIRHEEDVYDLGFGDIAEVRLMARIGLSAYMATKEVLTGKQVTTAFGKKLPSAGESFSRYLESKRTLYLSLGKQLLTGKDWLGNPVDLKDTALDNLPFEFFQAFVEAGEADGLWEDIANGMEIDVAKKTLGNLGPAIAALGGVGTGSYPVHAAATRSKFRNIVSQQKHGVNWDELTLQKQSRLQADHREQFAVLSERVRKEKVGLPFSEERTKGEEREAQSRVSKMLSKENKMLVKDIDLEISRMPKKWYLNDERYNRYQELIAQYLDERLSKKDFAGMDEKRRIQMTQIIVKVAKNKALGTLRREVGR